MPGVDLTGLGLDKDDLTKALKILSCLRDFEQGKGITDGCQEIINDILNGGDGAGDSGFNGGSPPGSPPPPSPGAARSEEGNAAVQSAISTAATKGKTIPAPIAATVFNEDDSKEDLFKKLIDLITVLIALL